MAVISVSLPSDGTTADVSDYNTPITTIVNEFNGNIDNANIKSGAAIDGSKLADASVSNAKLKAGAGEPGGAWDTWTPTWTNFTVSGSTVDAKYKQIGKTVHFKIKLTLAGGNVPSGNVSVSLPVTAISHGTNPFFNVGMGSANDGGALVYPLSPCLTSTTTVAVFIHGDGVGTPFGFVTSTTPFTWTNGDILMLAGTYEAA